METIAPIINESTDIKSSEFNVCPDLDDACFEPNRAGCQDGITLPLMVICPFLVNEEI